MLQGIKEYLRIPEHDSSFDIQFRFLNELWPKCRLYVTDDIHFTWNTVLRSQNTVKLTCSRKPWICSTSSVGMILVMKLVTCFVSHFGTSRNWMFVMPGSNFILRSQHIGNSSDCVFGTDGKNTDWWITVCRLDWDAEAPTTDRHGQFNHGYRLWSFICFQTTLILTSFLSTHVEPSQTTRWLRLKENPILFYYSEHSDYRHIIKQFHVCKT